MTRILKYKVAFDSKDGVQIKDVADIYLNEMGVRAVSFLEKENEYTELPILEGKSYLMEFSGSFDSKGFGIYTSMIIESIDDFKRYIVNFADGCFYAFNLANREDYCVVNNVFAYRCTIIGNEHQNPDLCKVSEEDFNKVFNLTE